MDNTKLTFSFNEVAKFLERVKQKSERSAFLIKAKLEKTYYRGLIKRKKFRDAHGFVPSNITFSPTYWCNLRCLDCYPDSVNEKSKELSNEIIDKVICEATEKWAVPFFTITGGECLPHAINIAKRNPTMLFQVYTNGTLITEAVSKEIAKMGNLFPLVSIEGLREETDRIRGKGIYDKVMAAMNFLKDSGAIFGVSFTLTANNADVWNDKAFIDHIVSKGALLGRFLTYIPTGKDADFKKVPSRAQREKQGTVLREIEKQGKAFYSLDYLNNPGLVNGCAAGGLRYVHIDPSGDIFPCVFISAPAMFNLNDVYNGVYKKEGLEINCLEDILIKDPLLKLTREIAKKRDAKECCLVIDNPKEFLDAYRNLCADYRRPATA